MHNYNLLLTPDWAKAWMNARLGCEYTKSKAKNEQVPTQKEVDSIISWLLWLEKIKSSLVKKIFRVSWNQAASNFKRYEKDIELELMEGGDHGETFLVLENGYKWFEIKDSKGMIWEGKMMNHCLDGYYAVPELKIFSLRDESNQPHCTVSFNIKDRIVSTISGKANSVIKPDYTQYVAYFLDKLAPEKVDCRTNPFYKISLNHENPRFWRLSEILNVLSKGDCISGNLSVSNYNQLIKFPPNIIIDGNLFLDDSAEVIFELGFRCTGTISTTNCAKLSIMDSDRQNNSFTVVNAEYSPSPFICVLDTLGFYPDPYIVDGMALMAAQARSLGFNLGHGNFSAIDTD